MKALYDTIGLNYADLRQPEPRIAQLIDAALGDAKTILNVGAGAGSYEPTNRQVTALDPSVEMIAQRPAGKVKAVQGRAEQLPFPDDAFDCSMASMTIHHWSNQSQGVAEMRRVTRDRVIFFTYDPEFRGLWLTDYFPELISLDEGQMPSIAQFEQWLGRVKVTTVVVPHDCTDGFLAAYWRRPAAYLDEQVRNAISAFWQIEGVSEGLTKLAEDLNTGRWQQRYAELLTLEALDCGNRLVLADKLS